MATETIILIAEDEDAHYVLIKKSLERSGISNEIIRFVNGQQILDFLFMQGDGIKRDHNKAYLLLLDISMPKVDGIEVLRRIKADPQLQKIPIVMLTASDDDAKTQKCRELGCTAYIVKPHGYDDFASTLISIGLFLSIIVMPETEKVT